MSEAEAMLDRFNRLDHDSACHEIGRCCGSQAWCHRVVSHRPFQTHDDLLAAANEAFTALDESDWLEAFSHHPQIGDLQSSRMKSPGNREWSASEQSGAVDTVEVKLESLIRGNREYKEKFGFIFIVCATGKSAVQMLEMLTARLHNDRETEINIAAAEQQKITLLRIDKWRLES